MSDRLGDQPRDARKRFARRTDARPDERLSSPPRVDDREALREELDAIEDRIKRIVERGREAFSEGSDSYDNASMAMIRLAALFEDGERFLPFLAPVTDAERRGIVTTRNIVSHHGDRSMDDGRFWTTITTDVPEVLRRLRAHDRMP